MKRLIINTQRYYELMVKPHFADLNPVGDAPGVPGAFTVMDDVTSSKKCIDVIGGGNILQRKDASCDVIYTPVAGLRVRTIEVDKLYGATKSCDEEFYTGCLEDFQNQSEVFFDFVVEWFGKLLKKDINSNAYFGDTKRANDASGVWSWNKYDGIFKWYARYIADGTIAAAQTAAIASGALTDAACFAIIVWAYDSQTELMAMLPDEMKAFYVSRKIASGYRKYMQSIGGAYEIELFTTSSKKYLAYEGIPIIVEAQWNPVMAALNNGTQANACILTIKGNFTFATDKTYGVQDENGKYVGFATWFDFPKQTWLYLAGMKAGTQIAYPELSVIALTATAN